jgi:hypothetical protein
VELVELVELELLEHVELVEVELQVEVQVESAAHSQLGLVLVDFLALGWLLVLVLVLVFWARMCFGHLQIEAGKCRSACLFQPRTIWYRTRDKMKIALPCKLLLLFGLQGNR